MTSELLTTNNNWKEVTLGELILSGEYEIRNNLRLPLSSHQRSQMQGTYPYYGAAGAIDSINDYKFEGLHLLVAEDGTVTSDGKKPMLQLVDGKFWVSNHAHIIRGKTDEATKRLFYFLSNININPYITGAVQPKLSKENLLRITFQYPISEEVKKSVTETLSVLDDKIFLLNKQNETLEQIAKTIFYEWFVEFNFPNKKGEPYKKSGGEMIESEIGRMPLGWEILKIKDLGKVICGKTPSKSNASYFGDTIPFIKIPDMHGQIFVIDTKESLSPEGADTQKGKYVPAKSICVSCIATVGLVSLTTKKSQTNQQINTIVPHNESHTEYLYFWFKNNNNKLIALSSGGTATLNMNTTTFSNIELLLPPPKVVEEYHSIASTLLDKMLANDLQAASLNKIRDNLLPKLMSGEVSITDKESIVLKKVETKTAPNQFKEAILIGGFVNYFANSHKPLSRYRYTKYSYLAKRFQGVDTTVEYARMPGGPYNPQTRYKGPESILVNKKYAISNGPGFVPGEKHNEVFNYFSRYGFDKAVEFVKSYLEDKSDNELELLATVDYAILCLKKKGLSTMNPAIIIEEIGENPIWKHKLSKRDFTEDKILNAMKWLKSLNLNYDY